MSDLNNRQKLKNKKAFRKLLIYYIIIFSMNMLEDIIVLSS